MARKYSVDEIDALRNAVNNRYLWGNAKGPFCVTEGGGSYSSRSFNETDRVKTVEEQVRTYMLAGITGPDLCKADSHSP